MQYESEGIIRRQIVKFITALLMYNDLEYVYYIKYLYLKIFKYYIFNTFHCFVI